MPLERMRRGRKVILDRCPQCDGVWIDRKELADVAQSLDNMDAHARWVRAHWRPRAGIARCPACLGTPVELPFFEMHIDYCVDCRGVWLDGNERIGLARALDHERTAVATYRHAAEAVKEETARCGGCTARVPLRETYMTAAGVRCPKCWDAALERAGDDYFEVNAKLARIGADTE